MSGFEGAGDASLLFIVGTDRAEQLKIDGNRFSLAGTTDLYKLLGRDQPFHRLHVTPNYFRQGRQVDLAPYTHILNLITEAEDNGRVLENVRKLTRGSRARIVNHPDAVRRSTRDQVSKRLSDVPGLLAPRAIRLRGARPANAEKLLEQAGLHFPVIVRRVGTHTGRIVGLFDNAREAAAALDGDGEYIATEFADFKSDDGIYRKYRVFFIGPKIIARHMLASDHWNIHARDRRRFMLGRPELIDDEKRLFEDPENGFPPAIAKVLQAVRDRMPLDFFGMDFGIAPDGRVVLFEANATMNFFPFLPDPELAHVLRCGPPAVNAFRGLVGLPPRDFAVEADTIDAA
jgi:hypothetical protein